MSDDWSGEVAPDASTESPADSEYDSNTTAILLVVAFVVAASAVYLCFAVARRRALGAAPVPEQQHTMRIGILDDELGVPEGDNPYLSLQLGRGQKDLQA
jgi:hypothetical protein